MLTRRRALAALAVLPLIACTSTPAAAPSPQAPPPAASTGDIVVYLPGAMATMPKPLTAAYTEAGLGNVSFEVGHTPIQREQLAKGATPDVWIAANPMDMKTAAEGGFVVKDAVADLARTKLVVVVAPGNPGGVTSVDDLTKDGVKVLLAAETLPIWMTTSKTLEKIEKKTPGFTDKLLANTVSREMGVQPIVQKIQLGEADAGIVFLTDVPADAKGLTTVDVPDDVNTTLSFKIAPVTAGKNPDGAKKFIEFMTSGAGHEVLSKVGYLPAAE